MNDISYHDMRSPNLMNVLGDFSPRITVFGVFLEVSRSWL